MESLYSDYRDVDGAKAAHKLVINRDGMPTGEPVIRQTSFRENRVLTSVAHREVKVQIILERFLPLTETNPSRRFN